MLWQCANCGCRGIAASVETCPMCNVAQPTAENAEAEGEGLEPSLRAKPRPPSQHKGKVVK